MAGYYVALAETHGSGGWSDYEWWESVSWADDCARFSDSLAVWVLTRVWISEEAWEAATDEGENVDVWNADRTVCAVRIVGGLRDLNVGWCWS